MTTVKDPNYPVKKNLRSTVKKGLKAVPDFGIQFEEFSNGIWYRNKYKLSEIEFKIEYEDTDFLENSETFILKKPTVIIRANEVSSNRSYQRSEGALLSELQLIVNTKPQGALAIDGYLTLLRLYCNPIKGKDNWIRFGLVPQFIQETRTYNGDRIAEKLKNRLLIRSLLVTFEILGESL